MSYKKQESIPRSKRTFWSPEKGGRSRQKIGDNWVKKFAFSPYTAKAGKTYSFYADIEMEQEIESPPGSGKKTKAFTMEVTTDTFQAFRDQVESGEFEEKAQLVVEHMGGKIKRMEYWRNKAREERPN